MLSAAIRYRKLPETSVPTVVVSWCRWELWLATGPLIALTPALIRIASANTIVEWPSENQNPTDSGRLPSLISFRVVLSIAEMWSASNAWRIPSVYAVRPTPTVNAPRRSELVVPRRDHREQENEPGHVQKADNHGHHHAAPAAAPHPSPPRTTASVIAAEPRTSSLPPSVPLNRRSGARPPGADAGGRRRSQLNRSWATAPSATVTRGPGVVSSSQTCTRRPAGCRRPRSGWTPDSVVRSWTPVWTRRPSLSQRLISISRPRNRSLG